MVGADNPAGPAWLPALPVLLLLLLLLVPGPHLKWQRIPGAERLVAAESFSWEG